ncbi:MAG: NADH-quinone oxidoreductase subunit C [Clostridiales Family XIII bacterium]|jgi:ech hydrogenase subunit D|nr:NADH-quinone oxidoreductase subunit C [Clostridiales Family XIII bacterium]
MAEGKHLIQKIVPVAVGDILNAVQDLKGDGYRLGQMCASKVKDEFQILYSFDKDYELMNLKAVVGEGAELPSITGIYWPAFIYENEIRDLFGFKFKNLALDYGGHFFKTAIPTPWNPQAAKEGGEDE